MFTSIDKAIVALIMAAVYLANSLLGVDFGLDEKTVTTAVSVVTPILVWLVPNKST